MEKAQKRPFHVEIFVPGEAVEQSAFLDKGSGMPDATLYNRFVAWFHEEFIDQYAVQSMDDFSDPLQVCVGFFLKICSIFLMGLFIILQYYTTKATTYISLDQASGNCNLLSLPANGVFNLDSNGYWSSNPLYNPSAGMYSLTVKNLQESNISYGLILEKQKAIFKDISVKMMKQDMADNLLYWLTWFQIDRDGDSSRRWQLTGDAKKVFERKYYIGTVSNRFAHCNSRSVVSYNPGTGKIRLVYSYADYSANYFCREVVSPAYLAYDPIDYDVLSVSWDATSLLVAASVNKEIIKHSDLTYVHWESSTYRTGTVKIRGILYDISINVDSRYPSMDPLMCYSPRSSVLKPFCVIRVSFRTVGYPFFIPYGPRRVPFEPLKCTCDPLETDFWCNHFSLMSGVALLRYNHTLITDFANSIAEKGINYHIFDAARATKDLAYYANEDNTFASAYSYAKEYDLSSGLKPAQRSLTALENLFNLDWRKSAYSFCTTEVGCDGIAVIHVNDAYDSSINGDYFQLYNLSCNSTIIVTDSFWELAKVPPIKLTQDYYNCTCYTRDCIITAVGTGSGTASQVIAIMIVVTVFFFTNISCFRRKKLISHLYKQSERDRAICHLATHLLMVRDRDINSADKTADDTAEGTFIRNLFQNVIQDHPDKVPKLVLASDAEASMIDNKPTTADEST